MKQKKARRSGHFDGFFYFQIILDSTESISTVWGIDGLCEHLRELASMRAVVKFFLRAASTLENTNSEERILRVFRKFSASRIGYVVLRQVIANKQTPPK